MTTVAAGAVLSVFGAAAALAQGSLQADLVLGLQGSGNNSSIDLGDISSGSHSQPVYLWTDGAATACNVTGTQASTSAINGSMSEVAVPTTSTGSNPVAGSISFTAPDAGTADQTYSLVMDFSVSGCTVETNSAPVTVTFTVAGTGTSGSTNHAPIDPGAPYLDSASTTPNNTGNFTVDWAGSTDPDSDAVTYTLQKVNSGLSSTWETVASGLTATSYTFTGAGEGSWLYRVQATDGTANSGWGTDSSWIVKVDKSNPNAPTVSSPTAADYTDGSSNNWYKDSVTVTFASNGDPNLADGSAGSGVNTVTSSTTYNSSNVNATTGAFSQTGYATDYATNQSTGTTVSGYVDWRKPVVSCPATTPNYILNASSQTLAWTASDPAPASGLATGASGGAVNVDTSSVGPHTVNVPAGSATDNVGHSSDLVTCSYTVTYNWNGFLQPINDTAHQVGTTMSIFKGGSTVPVKFQLTDANGNVVQSANAPLWVTPQKGNALAAGATIDESTYSDPATTGTTYRWDSTSQQYIYNWNTTKSQTGYIWRIGVLLDDGTTHYVSIGLK